MKKLFPFIFAILFILVFSILFGWEYKDFYDEKKSLEKAQKQLKWSLEAFRLENIKEIENIKIYETPNTKLLDEIEEKINTAKQKIYIEVYIFTNKDIRKALKNAKKRGIEIKVLLEHNPYKAPWLNHKTYNFLKESGIEVVWSNTKHYSLNHTKLMIIDEEAIISTGNLSHSTFTKNKDFFVIIQDAEIQSILESIFLQDFAQKKNISYQNNLLISPHYSRTKLEKLLESATKKIQIYIPYIQDENLKNILISQSKKGKNIEIISDKKFIDANSTYLQEMKKNEVQIKSLYKYNMHSKAILIDETYLFIGSINFSEYSLDKNKEIGILIKNKEAIAKFTKIFKKDWKESQ